MSFEAAPVGLWKIADFRCRRSREPVAARQQVLSADHPSNLRFPRCLSLDSKRQGGVCDIDLLGVGRRIYRERELRKHLPAQAGTRAFALNFPSIKKS